MGLLPSPPTVVGEGSFELPVVVASRFSWLSITSMATPPPPNASTLCKLPGLLQSVDAFGGGGGAIEVIGNQLNLLATTTDKSNGSSQPILGGLGKKPIPLDKD